VIVQPDRAGDHVVAFDTFKIVRRGGQKDAHWIVSALTPWAQDLLIRHANTLPPHERPQWRRGAADRIIGVVFTRRGEALEFLTAVEKTAEGYL
jgi:hypothetical protein